MVSYLYHKDSSTLYRYTHLYKVEKGESQGGCSADYSHMIYSFLMLMPVVLKEIHAVECGLLRFLLLHNNYGNLQ